MQNLKQLFLLTSLFIIGCSSSLKDDFSSYESDIDFVKKFALADAPGLVGYKNIPVQVITNLETVYVKYNYGSSNRSGLESQYAIEKRCSDTTRVLTIVKLQPINIFICNNVSEINFISMLFQSQNFTNADLNGIYLDNHIVLIENMGVTNQEFIYKSKQLLYSIYNSIPNQYEYPIYNFIKYKLSDFNIVENK